MSEPDRNVEEQESAQHPTLNAWCHHVLQKFEQLPEAQRSPGPPTEIINLYHGKGVSHPVMNVAPHQDKEILTTAELQPYIEICNRELHAVAQSLTAILGQPVSADQARFLLVERMASLMQAATRTYVDHEQHTDTYDLRRQMIELRRMQRSCWSAIRRLFSGGRSIGRQIDDLEQEIHRRKQQRRETPSLFFESGNTYRIHESSAAGFIGMRPQKDVVLCFLDQQKRYRALRLNRFQMELAKHGLVHQGEPFDDSANEKVNDWDQAAYPRSFLRFFQDHVEPWLKRETAR